MQFRFGHAGLAGIPALLVVDQAPSPMGFVGSKGRWLALDCRGGASRQKKSGNENYRPHRSILPRNCGDGMAAPVRG
jgi:hypothetical protein